MELKNNLQRPEPEKLSYGVIEYKVDLHNELQKEEVDRYPIGEFTVEELLDKTKEYVGLTQRSRLDAIERRESHYQKWIVVLL